QRRVAGLRSEPRSGQCPVPARREDSGHHALPRRKPCATEELLVDTADVRHRPDRFLLWVCRPGRPWPASSFRFVDTAVPSLPPVSGFLAPEQPKRMPCAAGKAEYAQHQASEPRKL